MHSIRFAVALAALCSLLFGLPAEKDEEGSGAWDDRGIVSESGLTDCVPVGCFEDVIVIKEYEPRFPSAFQLKVYAPGVGSIRIGWKGSKDEEREAMVLTEFHQLSAEELAEVRALVLEQEDRGLAYSRLSLAEPLS